MYPAEPDRARKSSLSTPPAARAPVGGAQPHRRVVPDPEKQQCRRQPRGDEDPERRAPSPARRDHAAEEHPQRRTQRCRCLESSENCRPAGRSEPGRQERSGSRAIARLTGAEGGARGEQLAVTLGRSRRRGGEAPDHAHEGDRAHSAPPVHEQRSGEGAEPHRDGHHRHERAELRVRQRPLVPQRRERRDDDLPVGEVEDHQRERRGEHHPRPGGLGSVDVERLVPAVACSHGSPPRSPVMEVE